MIRLSMDYQTAREYAADGINVFVPVLINRESRSAQNIES